MTAQPGSSSAGGQTRISSLGDVAQILSEGSLELRFSLLQMIAARPEQALKYKSKDDSYDLTDLLIIEMEGASGFDYRLLVLGALCVMPADPRIVSRFTHWLDNNCHNAAFKLMLAHLGKYPFESLKDTLLPLLFADSLPLENLQTLAAALLGAPELDARQRLRIMTITGATITGAAHDCPDYTSEKTLWLAALSGPFADQTHELLEQQGEPALAALRRDFETLPLKSQLWLLVWQKEVDGNAFEALLTRALVADESLAAKALVTYPSDVAPNVPLERFRAHPDPAVRAAAFRAGLDVDASAVVDSSEAMNVKLAALEAFDRSGRADRAAVFTGWLQHPSWQIRAAATDYLIDLGEAVDAHVVPLLDDTDDNVKGAAMRVFIEQDRLDRLESRLF